MKLVAKTYRFGILALLAVLAISAPAYARDGESTSGSNSGSGSSNSTTLSTNETEHGTETETETENETETQQSGKNSTIVEQKKTELKTKLEEKRQAIKTKLNDARLKLCKERETKINTVIDNSKTRAQRVLERLQNVEANVRAYYAKQNLSLSNFDTLSNAINDKEAAAAAAISVTGDTQFSCGDDDASRPGGIISDTVKAQNTALKAYRDAIHDLIQAIKQAKGQTKETN